MFRGLRRCLLGSLRLLGRSLLASLCPRLFRARRNCLLGGAAFVASASACFGAAAAPPQGKQPVMEVVEVSDDSDGDGYTSDSEGVSCRGGSGDGGRACFADQPMSINATDPTRSFLHMYSVLAYRCPSASTASRLRSARPPSWSSTRTTSPSPTTSSTWRTTLSTLASGTFSILRLSQRWTLFQVCGATI